MAFYVHIIATRILVYLSVTLRTSWPRPERGHLQVVPGLDAARGVAVSTILASVYSLPISRSTRVHSLLEAEKRRILASACCQNGKGGMTKKEMTCHATCYYHEHGTVSLTGLLARLHQQEHRMSTG